MTNHHGMPLWAERAKKRWEVHSVTYHVMCILFILGFYMFIVPIAIELLAFITNYQKWYCRRESGLCLDLLERFWKFCTFLEPCPFASCLDSFRMRLKVCAKPRPVFQLRCTPKVCLIFNSAIVQFLSLTEKENTDEMKHPRVQTSPHALLVKPQSFIFSGVARELSNCCSSVQNW